MATKQEFSNEKESVYESFYLVDKEELAKVRKARLWNEGQGTLSPKYFSDVKISASATVKMLQHAMRGVEKGMKSENGMPVEVMGLLLGRPSTDSKNPNYLVVTDAFPLPVEGVETRVEAGDEAMNFMIELADSLELTRDECIMGWYHSHPFDVGPAPSWFFSATDCQNQLSWQRNEDMQGNPWLGLVVDPLRSIAKGKPEIGAFRCFMPTYTQEIEMAPDGTVVTNKTAVTERWGNCSNRYYCLNIEYYMSGLTRRVVGILAKNFLWMSVLSASLKNEREYRERFSDRVNKIANKLESAGNKVGWNVTGAGTSMDRGRQGGNSNVLDSVFGGVLGSGTGGGATTTTTTVNTAYNSNVNNLNSSSSSSTSKNTPSKQSAKSAEFKDACDRANDIAVESSLGDKTQVTKQTLFGIMEAFTTHNCNDGHKDGHHYSHK
jgi:COP9 signalosome complex subunit 5